MSGTRACAFAGSTEDAVSQALESAPSSDRSAVAEAGTFELRQGILELPGELPLQHGGTLDGVHVAWSLAGARGAPIVVALGGISAHRHVFSSGGLQGWWDTLVGPGRALDSRHYRILGFDYLGGSGATTGPNGLPFPSVGSHDQAAVLLKLLDHLGISKLHAIVGASYGGMVALAFAELFPARVARLLTIGAADRTHPMATAWRSVQRRVLRSAIARGEGAQGVALARALAMATYRSPDEFAERFRAPPRTDNGTYVFPVEDYLFARGAEYAARHRPEAFLCLSESIDLHHVEAARIRVPTTIVAVREDQIVPLGDLHALCVRLGTYGRLIEISSLYGHDAFLKEAAQLGPVFRSTLESQS
jgi:homoserine O-acetyltransferase